MMSITDELKQKTLAYWKLSSIWNGRIQHIVTTGDALDICKAALESTSCVRPIAYRFSGLLDELIRGEGNKNPEGAMIVFLKQEIGATA